MALSAQVRRVYDEPTRNDGTRILVDRVWPRGIKKADAKLDEWNKDVSPSTELRKWYGHDPERFDEFRKRYRKELATRTGRDALQNLRVRFRGTRLTLLSAAKDIDHSQATVLAEILNES